MSNLYIPNDILLQLVHYLYQADPKSALPICSLQKKDLESEIRQYLVCRYLHKKNFNPTTNLLIKKTNNISWLLDWDDSAMDYSNSCVIKKNNHGKWFIYFTAINIIKLDRI